MSAASRGQSRVVVGSCELVAAVCKEEAEAEVMDGLYSWRCTSQSHCCMYSRVVSREIHCRFVPKESFHLIFHP